MPRLTASKEQLQGPPVMEEGLYDVRFEGFKPKWSKDKGSVNLNPQLKVINHAQYNDRNVFENLNSKGPWVWQEFAHAFGINLPSDGAGGIDFPGFDGPEDNPEAWTYSGPIVGQTAKVYLVQSSFNGKDSNKIKFYVCRAPGCTMKHNPNLAK